MTLGDAAQPLVHITDFRMDFGDTTVVKKLSFDVRSGETFRCLFRYGSIEYGRKLSIAGTFRRKELAAK